jgi:hypothetical protein
MTPHGRKGQDFAKRRMLLMILFCCCWVFPCFYFGFSLAPNVVVAFSSSPPLTYKHHWVHGKLLLTGALREHFGTNVESSTAASSPQQADSRWSDGCIRSSWLPPCSGTGASVRLRADMTVAPVVMYRVVPPQRRL